MSRRYADMLANLRAWCVADGNLTGAIIIGSQAQSSDDRWSDLDVMLVAKDRDALIADGDWTARMGEVLVSCDDVTPLAWLGWDWHVRRVLYRDGRDLDLSLVSHQHLAQALEVNGAVLARGYQILHDASSGQLERSISALSPSDWPPPRITSGAELQRSMGDLLYHLVWAAKKVARGETWVGVSTLNAHNAEILLVLAESCQDLEVGASDELAHEGRFVERRLDPALLAVLDGCMARYDALDARRAAGRQLVAARQLAARLGDALGCEMASNDVDAVAAILKEQVG